MQSDILQKFTTHLKNSLAYAVNTAIEYNMKTVTVDFLLLGLYPHRIHLFPSGLQLHLALFIS